MNTNVLTAPVTQAPSTQTTKRSLFDFYTSGIALSKLKEGKHTATLKSHQFIAGEGADAKPYVRLELDLPDRMIVDNRFEAGFSIFLDHIKEQLGKSDDNIAVQDLLSNLISEKTQFIMVTHRKGTMEAANAMYGVTMQEHGISKVVSMKMGEVAV
jgi:hypothetical protein